MAETSTRDAKETKIERGSRFFRNINILGAVALGGAALIAPAVLAAPLGVLAGVNVAQAGGFEVARRAAENRRLRRNSGKNKK